MEPRTQPPQALIALVLVAGALACSRPEEPRKDPSTPPAPPPTTPAPSASGSSAPFSMMLPTNQLRFVYAPKGADASAIIRDESARQKALGRRLLVYVGAKWCEPCQTFHHAAARGELDQAFPDLTLIEFDADADADRLRDAGYVSRFIPLFAVPADNGRHSGKFIEGSVKGERAVAEITPRLRDLLAKR
jgi:hypothetical protein